MFSDNPELLSDLAPFIAVIVTVGVVGWIVTTWMRIKHGYPLENSWGQSVQPQVDRESKDQIKLLNQENTQLRDELAGLKERLATVERIVTDSGYGLDQEIAKLEDKAK
ncbi:MAG: hypothetical protein ACTS1Z_07405 [Parasphingopyxis sp.]|uniref:hypothetical protein n=1 Tax=Parasphingopyxis sp. TaxID=1920299 RepID=UPI003F9EC6B7